ncbi:hypothetical protein Pelo_18118 [Pelomyxa schiedti]|nr:hypothetical protein Pelo_18118 [Pelomyxa schiedti]
MIHCTNCKVLGMNHHALNESTKCLPLFGDFGTTTISKLDQPDFLFYTDCVWGSPSKLGLNLSVLQIEILAETSNPNNLPSIFWQSKVSSPFKALHRER